MACSPFVEPSAPEFRAHKWRVGSKLAQASELIVYLSSGTEVHGPYKVIEAILLEIRVPVALKEYCFRCLVVIVGIPILA